MVYNDELLMSRTGGGMEVDIQGAVFALCVCLDPAGTALCV